MQAVATGEAGGALAVWSTLIGRPSRGGWINKPPAAPDSTGAPSVRFRVPDTARTRAGRRTGLEGRPGLPLEARTARESESERVGEREWESGGRARERERESGRERGSSVIQGRRSQSPVPGGQGPCQGSGPLPAAGRQTRRTPSCSDGPPPLPPTGRRRRAPWCRGARGPHASGHRARCHAARPARGPHGRAAQTARPAWGGSPGALRRERGARALPDSGGSGPGPSRMLG